ncbi:hypothetical protein K505DRAFT_99846 [Melanomma pulvis-pyrius CBS 109.77]|uniref:Uncharacterized protein n=1 Tax=Melanomma pulvis-pyrius CBS 109.77 TaxID=1314802 RepID=A0A6A6WYL9_9PLEO|nr:hypothetical protein K505DRAFT_99846 [Melanomma pulvis-pyrius CBS 109.77]
MNQRASGLHPVPACTSSVARVQLLALQPPRPPIRSRSSAPSTTSPYALASWAPGWSSFWPSYPLIRIHPSSGRRAIGANHVRPARSGTRPLFRLRGLLARHPEPFLPYLHLAYYSSSPFHIHPEPIPHSMSIPRLTLSRSSPGQTCRAASWRRTVQWGR